MIPLNLSTEEIEVLLNYYRNKVKDLDEMSDAQEDVISTLQDIVANIDVKEK